MVALVDYRTNIKCWKDLAYKKAKGKYGAYDINSNARYLCLIALQYDRQDEDYDLIRHCFKNEVIARENDSYQGIGEPLWLASYLLARYKRPEDIALFYRAKFANFDTGCGYDREYYYHALADKTEGYLQQHHPMIYKEVKGDFESMGFAESLDHWWQQKVSSYPENEEDESLYELYCRYEDLGQKEKARFYLEQWAADEADSVNKTSTLYYAYKSLGDYSKAIEMVCLLPKKEGDWERSSQLRDLINLYNLAGCYHQGFCFVQELESIFKNFDGWHNCGLGRMVKSEVFTLVINLDDLAIAQQAFAIAHQWCEENQDFSFSGAISAANAAARCGYTDLQQYYERVAAEEKQKI